MCTSALLFNTHSRDQVKCMMQSMLDTEGLCMHAASWMTGLEMHGYLEASSKSGTYIFFQEANDSGQHHKCKVLNAQLSKPEALQAITQFMHTHV